MWGEGEGKGYKGQGSRVGLEGYRSHPICFVDCAFPQFQFRSRET
jgi:hypothetical protein